MATTLVHPGYEGTVQAGAPAERLAQLKGKKIGLLDISKPGGRFFLDRLEELLRTRYEASDVIRLTKPTYTKNAPAALIQELRGVDAVVEGLAD
jgi:hypothetical protein